MSRYIKFDDAVKIMACEMYAEAQSQGYDVDGIEDFMPEAKAWITDAPSIDIVFCKECKYAEVADPTDDQDGYICQFHRGSIWFSGSYCSWGERKESE